MSGKAGNGRVAQIQQNGEKLQALYRAVRESYPEKKEPKRNNRAEKQWAVWEEACDRFHAEYDRLCYPGGEARLEELRALTSESIDTALDFLEADPYFFRSGYIKEAIWRRIGKATLKKRQQGQLENAAMRYLHRKMTREFIYMARVMARKASPEFWDAVDTLATEDTSEVAIRAGCLAPYRYGADHGSKALRKRAGVFPYTAYKGGWLPSPPYGGRVGTPSRST